VLRLFAVFVVVTLGATLVSHAQQTPLERLPPDVLDVTPPHARVRGTPGGMAVQPRPCPVRPVTQARRRIVDVAAQEWGFFGFRVVDRTEIAPPGDRRSNAVPRAGVQAGAFRRRSRLPPEEAERVASSIAGYWAVTSEGAWIVGRQNEEWKGADGIAARWNAPWSAAFISWVMCEAGLGTADLFQRAIAHHAYIDQAIRARDGRSSRSAFAAYDMGEAVITPGDLLCSSRQPVYRTVAERRRQMGAGARTHCDIVVKVDEATERILVIGGNVRGTVSLKVLRAERQAGKPLGVMDPDEERPIFVHLKLRAEAIAADALDTSATMQRAGCMLLAEAIVIGRRPGAVQAAATGARC
jgi:hypothetical protein